MIGVGDDGAPLTVAREWLGVYNLGYQIHFLFRAAVMSSFVRSGRPTSSPWKTTRRAGGRPPRRDAHGLSIRGLYAEIALFGRGVQLIGRQDSYHAANDVVPWVAMGYVAFALYGLSQAALMSVFAVRALAVLNGLALAVNLALNYLWIPEYGYVGAAAATTASFAVLALSSAWMSAVRGITPFSVASVLIGALLVAGASMAGASIDQATETWAIGGLAAKAGISLALIALLFAARPSRERRELVARIRPSR